MSGADDLLAMMRQIYSIEDLIPGITTALDVLTILLSGGVTYGIWVGQGRHNIEIYIGLAVLYAMMTISLFHHANLYQTYTLGTWPARLGRVFTVAILSCALLLAIAYPLKIFEQISLVWCILFWLNSMALIIATRVFCKRMLEKYGIRLTGSIAIVGASEQASRWLSAINRQKAGSHVVGIFDDRRTRIQSKVSGYPVLGDNEYLVSLVRQGQISKIVIALPWNAEQRLTQLVNVLREVPVTVCLAPDLVGYQSATLRGDDKARMSLVTIVPRPISGWSAIVKMVEDKILAGIALLLLSPLLVLIAVTIMLDSPGPVLFRQKRYGFNNQLFEIIKFRTFYHEERDQNAIKLTVRNDPRVTNVGRFLRRYSVDELPQLFNVLNGTMSMIGPRPHAKAAKAGGRLYQEVVSEYARRHNVKPGITGWAQVNGWRGETDIEEKIQKRVEYDLFYLENWSAWFDIKVLFLSVTAVIRGDNSW